MIFTDSANRTIEVLLGGSITTSQLDCTVSFVEINNILNTLTPMNSLAVTNNATAVTLLSAPNTGKQRQVKHISVFNKDTVAQAVTVRINDNGSFYTIVKVTLQTGEQLQFMDTGRWRVLTAQGKPKIGTVVTQPFMSTFLPPQCDAGGLTTTIAPSLRVPTAIYLGTCPKVSSTVKVQFRVTTLASSITTLEMGIYRGAPDSELAVLERLGTIDVSGVVNSTGVKTLTITLTIPTAIGDELWLVWHSNAGVAPVFRAGLVNDLSSFVCMYMTGASITPPLSNASSSKGISFNANSATARPWIAAQVI